MAVTTALRPRPEAFIQGNMPAFLLADPFENLPAARKEQKVVCEQLSHHPWHAAPVQCNTVVGSIATRETAIQKMSEAGIVLFSTHAKFISKDPYGSGLYVASDGSMPKMWTVDEIYSGGRLKSRPLIILSACESGMSYFEEGAEIVALPPAFVCMGAAAVLSSLWPVEVIFPANKISYDGF